MDSIELDESESIPVVRIRGALDISSAPGVYQRILEIIVRGADQITLDLSDVDLIDWAGLGAIAGVLWRTRMGGGDLSIAGATSVVREALVTSRLAEIVDWA